MSFPFSVWPQVLHGHADLTQDPASERAVILVVKLLKLWCLPDLMEEGHVNIWLQQQQQCGHGDEQDPHYHSDKAGHAQHASIDSVIGWQQAQTAGQDSAHSTSRSQAGALIGPVSLPLGLQLGLDVRISMELPKQPGGALNWRGEEQVDSSLAVVHWGGKHAGTGTGEERE